MDMQDIENDGSFGYPVDGWYRLTAGQIVPFPQLSGYRAISDGSSE